MNQPEKGLEGSDPWLCHSFSTLSIQGHLASRESGSGHLHLTFFLKTRKGASRPYTQPLPTRCPVIFVGGTF